MEKSVIADFLDRTYTKAEARAMNPLTLAYIGDGVFSDYIRKYLVAQGMANVNHLTKASIRYVKADAQARMVHTLMDQLTDEEQSIVRRGRNTRSTPPKNADKMDYRYATGLEALVGYLELTGNQRRLRELMVTGLEYLENALEC
ncbi:ribonuclease-3 family protein [Eubacterium aggregans]|uniref:Mini-ribonuclease 3 n=1 Tax=Eubacterium aggregans TaxID=81409 RepID=A0A1H4A082_9FIRM|nr:ribonuclease III domain-containing protein [Eubacterium aggregans]SEA28952.1 ribonuclease-3 family protein [Eubacterium aggregans]